MKGNCFLNGKQNGLPLGFLHSSSVEWLGSCDWGAKTGLPDILEDCGQRLEAAQVSAGSGTSWILMTTGLYGLGSTVLMWGWGPNITHPASCY